MNCNPLSILEASLGRLLVMSSNDRWMLPDWHMNILWSVLNTAKLCRYCGKNLSVSAALFTEVGDGL